MADDRRQAATLEWGVKQSFRNYVEAAGGTTEAGGGVARGPDGSFVFSAAPGEGLSLGGDGRIEGTGRFEGEVRFEAHGGMLKVFLADPVLEVGPAGAVITVADTPSRTRRVELARLDLAAATAGDDGALVIPAAMAVTGWQILGDHYGPGTPLDPVILRPKD
ncbi:MAG TPA: HtaA domain-containing protein [Caulobacteraceae bacterium]|nr:HtaA domain-containing protein [Caulobacteraceae bacterium]